MNRFFRYTRLSTFSSIKSSLTIINNQFPFAILRSATRIGPTKQNPHTVISSDRRSKLKWWEVEAEEDEDEGTQLKALNKSTPEIHKN